MGSQCQPYCFAQRFCTEKKNELYIRRSVCANLDCINLEIRSDGDRRMKQKIIFSLLVGVTLSAIGFYFALRNVSFADLLVYMQSMNYLWLIPAAAIGMFTFVLRALRWQVILSSSVHLPFASAFHPLMIGFMINTVLPLRVGELARPAIIKKQNNVDFSLGFTTVGAERILDAITLIALFAWMLATVHIDPDLTIEFRNYALNRRTLESVAAGLIRFCIVVAAGIVAISIPAVQRLVKQAIFKLPALLVFAGDGFKQKVKAKCCLPLAGVVDNIAAGTSMIKSPGKLVICLVYSLLIWLLQAFALYLVTFGSPGISLTFTQMTTVFIIICFSIMLPSVPGFWGLWEAGGKFGLALFGVAADKAMGFSLVSHVVLMIPVLVVGFVSAGITGVNIIQVSYRENPQRPTCP